MVKQADICIGGPSFCLQRIVIAKLPHSSVYLNCVNENKVIKSAYCRNELERSLIVIFLRDTTKIEIVFTESLIIKEV